MSAEDNSKCNCDCESESGTSASATGLGQQHCPLIERYSIEWCRRKRHPTTKLVRLLRERELGLRSEGSHFIRGGRELFQSSAFALDRSKPIENKLQTFPLRFTPDGKNLIAIAHNGQEILVLPYRGVQFGAHCSPDQLFNAVFHPHRTVFFVNPLGPRVSVERVQLGTLVWDCAFITPDSRYLIVCFSICSNEHKARYSALIRSNESLPPSDKFKLTDYTFYSVDLEKCVVVDKLKLEMDHLNVHSGMYLLDWTLAILSVQHQTIHILGIDRHSGMFVPFMQIGRSVLEDDPLWDEGEGDGPGAERIFTAFRQRFLAFLYREAASKGDDIFIQHFLNRFSYYQSLKMHKMQFVGPDLILIKMDRDPPNEDKDNEHMFVLLEWRKGNIVGVFSPNSAELLDLFERHTESFKNGHLAQNNFPNSMEFCQGAWRHYQNVKVSFIQMLVSVPQARLRLLSLLPFPNTQHMLASPYLDPALFHLNDYTQTGDLANKIERGRIWSDEPLRFFGRKTQSLHSQLFMPNRSVELDDMMSCSSEFHAARVLFHPIDPFAISLLRISPVYFRFYMPMEMVQKQDNLL